jgi:diguanylate cyclase (GGDEF)-like protein
LVSTAVVFLVGQVTSAKVVGKFQAASDESIAETSHNLTLLRLVDQIREDTDRLLAGDGDHRDDFRALHDGVAKVREQLLNPAAGVETEEGDESDAVEATLRHLDALKRRMTTVERGPALGDEERHHLVDELQDILWAIAAALEGATSASTEEVASHVADAGALHQRSVALALLALSVSLLVLIVAGLGMTRGVLQPLERFRRQVEAFAAGDRTGRAEAEGVDEIQRVARSFNDMAGRLNASESALTRQAFTDDLTGLPNRADFLARLERLAAAATANGATAGYALFIDVDHFKNVNDSFGHAYGDQLLQQASRRLSKALRAGDVAARVGGDEFGILLPGASLRQAEEVAARVQQMLSEPVAVSATPLTMSVSVGIAAIEPGSDADTVLRNADVAMYVAKAGGRNQHRVFSAEMHDAAVVRMQTESELRVAVQRDELVVHYQPIVRLLADEAYEVCSVEALVRWQHPERGLLMPGAFLDVAVETGLIEAIGAHVLRRTCTDLAVFRQTVPELSASVNMTARELHHPTLVDVVREALGAAGLPGDALIVELTESEAVVDVTLAAQRLAELRSLGVRVALDDFGTGYSSLSYLRQLPIDTLKVDRSFIGRISSSNKDFDLVDAVLAMSRALGLETVAEGIETHEVQRILTTMGFTYGQGYGICRPQPRDKLVQWLAAAVARPRDDRSLPAPRSVPALHAQARR